MFNSFFAEVVILIFLGGIFAFFGAPFAVSIAKKLGAIDLPNSALHKRHTKPMPLAGGFLAFAGTWLLFFLIVFWQYEPSFLAILLAGTVIFVFGVVDDIYGLSAPKKFLGQFLAAIIFVRFGISVYFLETLGLSLPAVFLRFGNYFLSFFWLIGITNAFNLIDSMDGLVAGITLISASFFSFLSFLSGQLELALFSSILIGLSFGLYLHNKQPALFFLGDSGAQLFGFFLAAIALLYRPPDLNPKSTWFIPILLLGMPIFDTTLVTVSRLRRHKPVFQADRTHFYHRLIDFGLNPNLSVLLIQGMTLMLSLLAFVIMFFKPVWAFSAFLLILLCGVLLIVFLESRLHE